MGHNHTHSTDHKYCSNQLDLKKRKTAWVLLISLITMILEISFGYITNSMALLSDGWHMASHVVAIGASWLAYRYVTRKEKKGEHINTGKTLSYVGFFNATVLAIIAITVIINCINRFNESVEIHYEEAIVVSIIGLIVNLLSAKILHHHDEHSDHNLRAAYIHVISDVLTSALAIIALLVGFYWGITKTDTIVGIIGSLVILNWAKSIILQSYKEIKTETLNERHH